ncbi:MAG: Stk1 family PASTA domain-containing Ser/Thr kinase [Clostridiaceae bacterium]|jgi:beta-lactam-binding protein with PASTA domain/predicted Ser/Thr protein kinase|nr:Stk1 family PASTA domain-containing Ser/Thr kinase [Clostridiaceae bacterium]
MVVQPFTNGVIVADRYRVIKMLGQGGMATVYLALDLVNHTEVALKVMHGDLADDPEFVRRFATEARAAASLNHPNIVRVLDYGSRDGIRYIAQEYIEGITLKELIQKHGALDYHIATPLAIQIGLALEHAHEHEVIHRDIKPQNILITPDMSAKVTDFGIARASSANTITLTGGIVMGSVHYFSPEQARGGKVTARSDLYALGIVFYEMLTAKLPFDGESSVAIAIKHLQEMAPPPSTIVRSLPPALDRIIHRAIQKNPDARYQSAQEFVDELDAFMIDPNGIYGVIPRTASTWDGDSTSALSVQNGESHFSRLRDIERTYNKRRSSRYRDTAIAVTVVAVAIALLALLTVWLVRRFTRSDGKMPSVGQIVLNNFNGSNINDIANELNILESAGMKIVREYEENETVLPDIIFKQDPESDGTLKIDPRGMTLTLYISLGRESIEVPDLVGKTVALAEQQLRTLGFLIKLTREPSDTVPVNEIIEMIPEPGTPVAMGSLIELVYSSGASEVVVPNCTHKRYNEAINLLSSHSLVLGGEESYTGRPVPDNDKFVISQRPAPNEKVPPNTLVHFVVGTAQDLYNVLNPTTQPVSAIMPLLRGKTLREAQKQLSSLGVHQINLRQISGSTTSLDVNKREDWDSIYIIEQVTEPGVTFMLSEPPELIYGSYEDYQHYITPTTTPPPETTTTTTPETTTTTTTESSTTTTTTTTTESSTTTTTSTDATEES